MWSRSNNSREKWKGVNEGSSQHCATGHWTTRPTGTQNTWAYLLPMQLAYWLSRNIQGPTTLIVIRHHSLLAYRQQLTGPGQEQRFNRKHSHGRVKQTNDKMATHKLDDLRCSKISCWGIHPSLSSFHWMASFVPFRQVSYHPAQAVTRDFVDQAHRWGNERDHQK